MVKPYSPKKAKKPLFYKLSAGAVSLVVLGLPLFAQASVLSALSLFLERSFSSANAQGTSLNSQTMPLLQPAVNLDPNPAVGGGDIAVAGGTALVPTDSPAGTSADVEEKPRSSQISVYTVRAGDTLSDIATMFDVSVNTIIWANDIKDRVIQPGDMLIILPVTGLRHTVVKGETLASLAKSYKGDAAEIASYNELPADASLAVGSVVIIPNGEVAPAPTAATASGSRSSTIHSIASGKTTEPYLGGSGPAIAGYFAWPLQGGIITQGLHGWNAVDIGAPKGTSIFAAAEGTVIIAKNNGGWNGGYGNYVVIQHPNGTQTLYAHATTVLVSPGDHVAQGQTIAKVGMTGLATGPHLHFEVRGAANPFAK